MFLSLDRRSQTSARNTSRRRRLAREQTRPRTTLLPRFYTKPGVTDIDWILQYFHVDLCIALILFSDGCYK